MSSAEPLRAVEPRPISPQHQDSMKTSPHLSRTTSAPQVDFAPAQIPDHPSSMLDVPRASNNYGRPLTSTLLPQPTDIGQLRSQTQYNLREYQALQRRRIHHDGNASTISLEIDSKLRTQQGMVLASLRQLQDEVKIKVKEAENHRWRKWLLGGAIASFVPLVRKIFRRGSDPESDSSANDTEYAFKRSQGLVSYLKTSVLGKGGFASMAFFVFAVLYVFQNEVSLRVAKTVQKRVRKLTARIERGDPGIHDRDFKLLEGWRWRVLLW